MNPGTIWLSMALSIGLAVGALVGIRRRSGRARAWYVVALVLGGLCGLWLSWPDDSVPAPWGMMIGIAAAGLAPALTSAVRAVLPRIADAVVARVSRRPCGHGPDEEDEEC